MSIRGRFKSDIRKLSDLKVKYLDQQLGDYEKKLRLFTKQVDLRSKEARSKLKKTRKDLEKNIQGLIEKERKKLDSRVNDFLNKLLSAAQGEKKSKRSPKRRSRAKKAASEKTS